MILRLILKSRDCDIELGSHDFYIIMALYLKHMLNIKAIKKPIFLTFHAKKALNYSKQAFIKTLIL